MEANKFMIASRSFDERKRCYFAGEEVKHCNHFNDMDKVGLSRV